MTARGTPYTHSTPHYFSRRLLITLRTTMEYEILDTDFADDPRQDPHHVGDDDASLHSVRSIVEGDVQVEDGAHVATPSHVDRSTRTRESIRHLSRVEKQARQRAQNRKAAEKSRHKKKVEQWAQIEICVAAWLLMRPGHRLK